jgi:hypothetical protein
VVPVDTSLLAVALVVGVVALAAATGAVTRRGTPPPRTRAAGAAPLVPWLGTVLVVVLLVRGSWPAAVFVAAATLLHAAVVRARATTTRR